MIRKIISGVGAVGTSLFVTTVAFAQDAAASASAAATSAAATATQAAAAATTAAAAGPMPPAAPPPVDIGKLSATAQAAFEATMVNKGDTT